MFTKILFAIDFSPAAHHAMRVALRIASDVGAELVLVHVVEAPPALGGERSLSPAVLRPLTDEAQGNLDEAARDAAALGARVNVRLQNGAPWHELVRVLEEDAAFDLVVMGTHGRTETPRVFLGPVAEKVVRHAPYPVLVIRPDAKVALFDRVLCPIDFSDRTQLAVDLAARLARPGGAGITLLHVVEAPASYSRELPAEMLRQFDLRATDLLEGWATQLRPKNSVPVTTRVTLGGPGARTLAVLDHEPTFGLVVVGSHGRTGIPAGVTGLGRREDRSSRRVPGARRPCSELVSVATEHPRYRVEPASTPSTFGCPRPSRCSTIAIRRRFESAISIRISSHTSWAQPRTWRRTARLASSSGYRPCVRRKTLRTAFVLTSTTSWSSSSGAGVVSGARVRYRSCSG